MSIRTDLGRTSIHGAIQKLGISVINPVRRDIGGGGNSPKDLRSSRHAVNHSLSKLLGKIERLPYGSRVYWPTFGCANGEILEAAGTAGENTQIL